MSVRSSLGTALAAVLFLAQTACASLPSNLKSHLHSVQPGSVVIVSENHGDAKHHQNQIHVLNQLASQNLKVSVGMEFFDVTQQTQVDAYLAGAMSEDEFLKSIKWSGTPFSNYRTQVLFPKSHGGKTIALNAPRRITAVVSKSGIDALTPNQRKIIPRDFKLGNDLYRERFAEAMKTHIASDAINRYFEAQSLWDDVMAETAVRYLRANPEQVLVILVGDFHVAYGGGLPDRLRAKGQNSILTISQINPETISETASGEVLQSDPRYGPRADFVWVTP